MKSLLYPAIDLLAGRAVRLRKGERSTARVYSDDPPGQARDFVEQGALYLHVVDLDAAFGEKRQFAAIERIAKAVSPVPVQVGGGIRDLRSAEETIAAGAARIILGTAAVERPALAGEAVAKLGSDRVACGIDVKAGFAAVRGWTDAAGTTAAQLAAALAAQGVEWLVVTSVVRDGTLEGFDLDLLREVAQAAPRANLIASGGLGDLSHLRDLARAAIPGLAGAIAGTALYEGRFQVREAQQALSC
jgi:phosphoribosylformimino-5-aminoimidazole carboxamide ribotide isomerase